MNHGTWPRPSVDDLVIALMMAVMTDGTQHTLLTRFVPIMPDDPGLTEKIAMILADVDAVLPAAVELLAGA